MSTAKVSPLGKRVESQSSYSWCSLGLSQDLLLARRRDLEEAVLPPKLCGRERFESPGCTARNAKNVVTLHGFANGLECFGHKVDVQRTNTSSRLDDWHCQLATTGEHLD